MLIEYVPYGDLLGYLRKSRGLNDTYYKDQGIKPQTRLTSQQLMKFAWQIADGMSYLSLRKASLGLRGGITSGNSKKGFVFSNKLWISEKWLRIAGNILI